ncbi:hypothetical protein [Microbacterium panaciterrae]
MITFEEVPHEPGSVFLYSNIVNPDGSRGRESASFQIDRAELVLALCQHFDLISQLALFLDLDDRLEELDWVDRNAHPAD